MLLFAGPPSNYDENGILTTDRGSLTELRLVKASSTAAIPNLVPNNSSTHKASHNAVASKAKIVTAAATPSAMTNGVQLPGNSTASASKEAGSSDRAADGTHSQTDAAHQHDFKVRQS